MWRWDQQEPFGVNVPDENPSGLGAFDLPLRLPGQRYDVETGLLYNTKRDYDSSGGRYIESDPIGLRGGLNTYAYVKNDPLRLVDPTGEAFFLLFLPFVGGGSISLSGVGSALLGGAAMAAILSVPSSTSANNCPAVTDADKVDCDKWRKKDEDKCYENYDTPGLRWVQSACLEWARKRWLACYRGDPDPGPYDDSMADGLPPRPKAPRR